MYIRSVNGIIFILIYGFNSVNCEDDGRFGKVLIFISGFWFWHLFLYDG